MVDFVMDPLNSRRVKVAGVPKVVGIFSVKVEGVKTGVVAL